MSAKPSKRGICCFDPGTKLLNMYIKKNPKKKIIKNKIKKINIFSKMDPPYTAPFLNNYRHTTYNRSMNDVFNAMFMKYTNLKLENHDVLPVTAVHYITTTLNIQCYSDLFCKIATRPGNGHSCVNGFLREMIENLKHNYACSDSEAKLSATTVVRLFINGIQLGIKLVVIWNENNENRSYVCKLGAAQYTNQNTLGWVVSSNSFANYEFDLIKDEWYIPMPFFQLHQV